MPSIHLLYVRTTCISNDKKKFIYIKIHIMSRSYPHFFGFKFIVVLEYMSSKKLVKEPISISIFNLIVKPYHI